MNLEAVSHHGQLNKLAIKGRNAWLLTMKVLSELADPRQLLNPQRRIDLLNKGRGQLISLAQPIAEDTVEVEQQIVESMIVKEIAGDQCLVSKGLHIGAVVFSPDTKVRYNNPSRSDFISQDKLVGIKWIITSTTHSLLVNMAYPQLGYKDSTGVINDFQKRRSQEQSMGGMYVNNALGVIDILDYDQLMTAAEKNLLAEEVLIMANWYMDSINQNRVCAREQENGPFNAIGLLQNTQTNQSLLFAISSGSLGYISLRKIIGEAADADLVIPRTKREVAAMCNILAQRFGYNSWKVSGVDYNGGGLHSADFLGGRDRFQIYI